MNRSTVYTLALAKLGEANYKQHTGTDGICLRLYPEAVRTANAMAHWSFARTKRTLSPLSAPAVDSVFTYNLPADCLRVIAVLDTRSLRKVAHFSIYGRTLHVNGHDSGNITLEYTSDIIACREDLPDEAPLFCQYVVTLLAEMICPTVTGDLTLQQRLKQEARQQLYEALTADRQQTRSNDQHPLKGILERSLKVGMPATSDSRYYSDL